MLFWLVPWFFLSPTLNINGVGFMFYVQGMSTERVFVCVFDDGLPRGVEAWVGFATTLTTPLSHQPLWL